LPAQVALVGDDVVNDFEGARAAGLHALLIDPSGKGQLRRLGQLLGHEQADR
jgi:putative hydrolase of the HAD superfamily